MSELLQEYTAVVTSPDGATYTVRSYGEERDDGTWIGWLEFKPADPRAVVTLFAVAAHVVSGAVRAGHYGRVFLQEFRH